MTTALAVNEPKSVIELATNRQFMLDAFNNKEVDDDAVDLPAFDQIQAVEAQLVKATYETPAKYQVGSKILLDNNETPHDWDCFKANLFVRMQQFI